MISCDLCAIVVSGDASVVSSLPAWLQSMGIGPIVYGNTPAALQAVTKQRVDAIFVDSNLDPEFSVLGEIRIAPAGRKLIGMAITSRQTSISGAFRFADFVLEKPLLQQSVMQTLRTAHGMMMRDRLQYTRIPLETSATVSSSNSRSSSAIATNVSQTGIALQSDVEFVAGEIVQIQFRLPEVSNMISCKAKAIWTDRTKTGFSFSEMKSRDQEALSGWIEGRFIAGWQAEVPAAQSVLTATAAQPKIGFQVRTA
jgi:FixJ family two-component response regulator